MALSNAKQLEFIERSLEIAHDRLYFWDSVDGDVVVLGHCHRPFVECVRTKMIINPGSTGQPRGINARPSYVILHTQDRRAEIKYIESEIPASAEIVPLPKKKNIAG